MCKKKRDSVKYLRRWISVAAAAAALLTPRILTKYSRSFICFRRNISFSLSLARAFLRSYIFVSNMEPNVYPSIDTIVNISRRRQKQQVVEIDDTALTKKTFLVRLFVYLTSFRSSTEYVLLYTRCHSNFLTISLPLSISYTNLHFSTIFAPYSLNSRMRVPTPPNFYYQKKLPVRIIEKRPTTSSKDDR